MTEMTNSPSEWIDGYGYEYESAKALLLREKAVSHRNNAIENLYTAGRPQGYVLAWCEGYDASLKRQAGQAEIANAKARFEAIKSRIQTYEAENERLESVRADLALRNLNWQILARNAGNLSAAAWRDQNEPSLLQSPS